MYNVFTFYSFIPCQLYVALYKRNSKFTCIELCHESTWNPYYWGGQILQFTLAADNPRLALIIVLPSAGISEKCRFPINAYDLYLHNWRRKASSQQLKRIPPPASTNQINSFTHHPCICSPLSSQFVQYRSPLEYARGKNSKREKRKAVRKKKK